VRPSEVEACLNFSGRWPSEVEATYNPTILQSYDPTESITFDPMGLNTLHTASGLIIIIGFLSKIALQAYIDFRHGRLGSMMAEVLFFSKYLKPYRAEVEPEWKFLKYACNLLLRLVVVSFIINFLIGMLILL
jgi:hypothetical protein